jgi:hypothetical protein
VAQEERNCLLCPEISLTAGSNSLIGSKEIPVKVKGRTELACKALIYLPILLRWTLNLATIR